jgi:hypothetical protein
VFSLTKPEGGVYENGRCPKLILETMFALVLEIPDETPIDHKLEVDNPVKAVP